MCRECHATRRGTASGAPGKGAHEIDIKVERLLSFPSRIIFLS
jgi:hypothetical protein